MRVSIFIILFITAEINCLFFEKEKEFSERNQSYLLRNYKITFEDQINQTLLFPNRFSIYLLNLNKTFSFELSKSPDATVLIFNQKTNELINSPVDDTHYQVYTGTNNNGFAALIKNGNRKNPYRLMASIFGENNLVFEIFPINLNGIKAKRNANNQEYDSYLNNHAYYPRYYRPSNNLVNNWLLSYRQLALNQIFPSQHIFNKPSEPVRAVVETLVVTDGSVFDGFMRDSQIKNLDYIFQSMRIYYNHLMNSVNKVYNASFITDPDLRIEIKVVHYLFLVEPRHLDWVRMKKHANSIVTVLGRDTLASFSQYINQHFSHLSFDHAIGFIGYQIEEGFGNSQFKSLLGLSWTPGICSLAKYSIINEPRDLSNTLVTAHEIAHNFNVIHDELTLCSGQGKHIMATWLDSMDNLYTFSSCSIHQFKVHILDSYGRLNKGLECLDPAYIQRKKVYDKNQSKFYQKISN